MLQTFLVFTKLLFNVKDIKASICDLHQNYFERSRIKVRLSRRKILIYAFIAFALMSRDFT